MEPLNDLTILLALFPEKPWKEEYLSANPNISVSFIENHNNIKWDYGFLSRNPNITIDFVHKNQNQSWKFYYLSKNPNIKWKPDDYIIWRADGLAENPNVTWDMIRQNRSFFYQKYNRVSENANITWEMVQMTPSIPWSYTILSDNPNVNWEVVRNNLDKDWLWKSLSRRIPISTILNNLTYNGIQLSWDFFTGVSENPTVTWKVVSSHPEIQWGYEILTKNPGITWDDIRKNLPINPYVSVNPNLNWKIVYINQEKNIWNFQQLSQNTFGYRTYAWSEFLADKEVDDQVKLKVLTYHLKDKETTNLELIMAIYNPNNPDYLPLVGYYFTEKYPNLGFDQH